LKPTFDLEENFCRNPSSASSGDTIWCYTTDPNTRWEYCNPVRDNDNGLDQWVAYENPAAGTSTPLVPGWV